MKKVRMLHHPTIPSGTILDLPDDEAAHLVTQMRAEFVIDAPAPKAPEAAVVEPTERAVKPAARGRKG